MPQETYRWCRLVQHHWQLRAARVASKAGGDLVCPFGRALVLAFLGVGHAGLMTPPARAKMEAQCRRVEEGEAKDRVVLVELRRMLKQFYNFASQQEKFVSLLELGLAESMQATGAASEPTTCDEEVHMSSNTEAASSSAGPFVQKRITTLHQRGNPSG